MLSTADKIDRSTNTLKEMGEKVEIGSGVRASMPTDLASWIEIINGGMAKYGVINPIFSSPSIHISTTT